MAASARRPPGRPGGSSRMQQQAEVVSPCIGVCRLDAAGALCVGCLRSLAEITWWRSADDKERRAILDRIALRRVSQSNLRVAASP
ncbi:MAG: DUF1289 domain-containing protein [Rhodospirillales bacterium]